MPSPREERLVGELGEYASLSRLAEVTGLPASALYQLRREGKLVRLGTRASVRALAQLLDMLDAQSGQRNALAAERAARIPNYGKRVILAKPPAAERTIVQPEKVWRIP